MQENDAIFKSLDTKLFSEQVCLWMVQLFSYHLLKKPQLLRNLRTSCLPDIQISGRFGLNIYFIRNL